ncbi:hypothetical protein FRC12_018025, partial [Ceratobasidium sp. 428]
YEWERMPGVAGARRGSGAGSRGARCGAFDLRLTTGPTLRAACSSHQSSPAARPVGFFRRDLPILELHSRFRRSGRVCVPVIAGNFKVGQRGVPHESPSSVDSVTRAASV